LKKKSNELLDALREHIPEDPYMALLLGMSALGAGGLLYSNLSPAPAKPEEILPSRHVRLSLEKHHRTPEDEESLSKYSNFGKFDANFLQRMLLGAAVPIGAYGLYSAWKTGLEQVGKKRLRQKLEYVKSLTDPRSLEVRERARQKTASADESLADVILESLAAKEIEKRAGFLDAVKASWRWAPYALGGLAGTSGLAAYLLSKRQLMPESLLKDPLDVRER